jgi:ATP-dependent Clp protease ATP-binding subunit ClpA
VFERFTERARQVVVSAQDEARALDHNYIGTEHILLALLREGQGLAAEVLGALGISHEKVRDQVTQIVGRGDEVTTGQIPFTPRATKVLEFSSREALAREDACVGTEHLLLGLVRENDGVAARILLVLGADPERVRGAVKGAVDDGSAVEEQRPHEPVWKVSPSGVQYMVVTHAPSDERSRLLGLWLAAPTVVVAIAVLFGLGLLVGWLVWG